MINSMDLQQCLDNLAEGQFHKFYYKVTKTINLRYIYIEANYTMKRVYLTVEKQQETYYRFYITYMQHNLFSLKARTGTPTFYLFSQSHV